MNPFSIFGVENLYRLSRSLYLRKYFRISKGIDSLNRMTNKCAVYGATDIGIGTQFAYGGIAVVIHKRAVIGKKCMIGQCCTIGRVPSNGRDTPEIGNNVYIGAGSKILGGVTIGDNSIIGPNAVITKNVDPFSVMVGVPGRLLTVINSENIGRFSDYGVEQIDQ